MSLAHDLFHEFDDGTADVSVIGRLDVSAHVYNDVARACDDGARLILVDVGGVSGVTPSGMAELLHAVRWARSRRADLRMYGSSPAVADALLALELDKVLVLYSDRSAALNRDRARTESSTRASRFSRLRRRSREMAPAEGTPAEGMAPAAGTPAVEVVPAEEMLPVEEALSTGGAAAEVAGDVDAASGGPGPDIRDAIVTDTMPRNAFEVAEAVTEPMAVQAPAPDSAIEVDPVDALQQHDVDPVPTPVREDSATDVTATATDIDVTVTDIDVTGRLDVSSSIYADVAKVCQAGTRLVLVDVGGVSGVTPSGMADLMHAVRSARSHRSDLRIFGSSPAVADALDALELGKVIVLYPDRDAALRRVRDDVAATRRGRRPARIGKRSRSEGSS